MLKKMMLLAMAVGALVAFAAPAVASAEVTFTKGGKALKNGDPITAISTNTKTTTEVGTLFCNTVTLSGEIDASGEISVGTVTAVNDPGPSPFCPIEGVTVAKITNASVGSLTVEAGTATAVTFLADVVTGPNPLTEFVECHFAGSLDITHTTNTISITPTEDEDENLIPNLTGTGPMPPCPSAGTIEGDFSLSSEGVEVTIDP